MPRPLLAGLPLRYALLVVLARSPSSMSVPELAAGIETLGFGVELAPGGRVSKAISDALRWEVRRGRVVRLRRNCYSAGRIPGSTLRRAARWLELVNEARQVTRTRPRPSGGW